MLKAEGISFAYDGAPELYHALNLEVAPEERVALCAPSGFGKTTLCRLLAGYLHPAAGRVTVDGAPLPRRGACPVQMVGQHPERMVDGRMTMRSILEEGGPVDDETTRALGIREEWLGRRPHELSGGELQRFCVARALAARPRYLVADEISTMLDALTQAQLWSFLLAWADEHHVGLVVVSHSPALTRRVATRVVRLDEAPA